MSAKKRGLDRLKIVSPCSTDWDQMSGDEKKRFCSECGKFVYDFSQMTRRQVEAIVSIHQGRMCARMTRRPDGSLLTLEDPPINPIVSRRASPVVNATLAAILGLSVPANVLSIEGSPAQLIVRSDADSDGVRTPYGGGEALVGGTVLDPQGAVIPNAVVKLISDAGAELTTKSSAEGEFTFAQVPFGAYIMLVEAYDFYTHVNANVIVDTPHDMRFEVAMKVKPGPVMGGTMFSPASLLDLYQLSELVAVAHIGRSTVVESDGRAKQIKTTLRISEQLKGENSQQVIPFYNWVDDFDTTTFNPGDRLLVFLRRRETEEGKRLDGYEATFSRDSIKELDDGALGLYRQRIEELSAIFRRGVSDPPDLVEWLVRCVEEPATRGEGVSKLAESLYMLASQRDQENRDKYKVGGNGESEGQTEDDKKESNEQPADDEAITVIESVKLASALTQDHKNRLTRALFSITELGEADMELVSMIVELGDERLAPYLVSQLRRVSGEAPRFAESLVWMIARVFKDEDLKRLAGDYDKAATYDESEYDEADRRNSTRNRRSGDMTVAAVKRSALLKDFLKLVEYKSKQ